MNIDGEPIEVIDYSSDEDFVLDGDEPDEGSEGASFASEIAEVALEGR